MSEQPLLNSTQTAPTAAKEQLLQDAVEEFIQGMDDGVWFDHDQFLSRYPTIREELAECLESLAFVRAATESGGFPAAADADSQADDRWVLGDFRVKGEIGRGGMGIVYRAEQTPLGRQVALKVLPLAALLDARQLKRFRNEARAAAMLTHPHIVSVYSVGNERGVHYYAMELIEGYTLAEIISTIASPPTADSRVANDTSPIAALSTCRSQNRRKFYRDVARLGIQAAEALHYAHQQSVVHRDVKPSNLLIDQEGNLHVADFGLAQVQTGEDLTLTGDLVGTLRYMSPEQWQGVTADARSDVYGLGLTLYEVLAGVPAHDGNSRQELMRQVLDGTPRKLTSVDQRIPRDLATIVRKAIERDPSDRYQSAQQMADDLQRFLEERSILARPTTKSEQFRRWTRRNPLIAALVSGIAMLLLVLAGGSGYVAWRSLERNRLQQRSIYSYDIRLAQQAIQNGNALEAERILSRWYTIDPDSSDPRGFEWFHLWSECHDPALEQTLSYRLPVYAIQVGAEGRRVVVGGFSSFVDVWDLKHTDARTPELRLDGHANLVHSITRLSDPTSVVVGDSDGQIFVWDIQSGQETLRLRIDAPSDHNAVDYVDHSADDRLILAGAGSGRLGSLHIWDRECNEWVLEEPNEHGRMLVAFGPQDELISTSLHGGVMEVRSLREVDQGGISRCEFADATVHELGDVEVEQIAIAPERTVLAIATRDSKHRMSQLELWDTRNWRRTARIPLAAGSVSSLAFSRDQKQLAIGHDDGTLVILNVEQSSIAFSRRLHAGVITSIAYSATNDRLLTGCSDGQLLVWQLSDLLKEAQLAESRLAGSFPKKGVAFMHEQLAAVSDANGRIWFIDPTSGQEVDAVKLDNQDANMVQLTASPDGKILAVTCGHFPGQETPGRLFLLDMPSRKVVRQLDLPHPIFYSMSSFSVDSRHLAIGCYNHVVVFDVEACRVAHDLSLDHSVKHVAYSPDGRWLACSVVNGEVAMFDARTWEPSHRFRTNEVYSGAIAFSPDAKILAVVGFDNRIELFDPATGKPRGATFERCQMYPATLRFSHDGTRLVTGGMDGKVRIWDVQSGEALLEFDVLRGNYPHCAFSPDDRRLIVTSGPTLRIFDSVAPEDVRLLPAAELSEAGCVRVLQAP